jgi:hypothetical protein
MGLRIVLWGRGNNTKVMFDTEHDLRTRHVLRGIAQTKHQDLNSLAEV